MLYHRSETGDNKLIGFFSTKQKAVEIMNNRKKDKGFKCRNPSFGFS